MVRRMSWLAKTPNSRAPEPAGKKEAQTAPAQAPTNGNTIDAFKQLEAELRQRFVGRDREIRAAILALASGEPMYWEGPPGTAKTSIVETLASLIGARYFYVQLHEYIEPDEVLGPIDVVALRERGELRRVTSGYLPEAEVAFFDEVYRASGAMLNMLIDIILNKRVRIGNSIVKLPTVAMYFAANFRRSEEEFAAFHDRLVLRVFSDYVADKAMLKELVERGLELLQLKAVNGLTTKQLLTVGEVRKFQLQAMVKAKKVVAGVLDKVVEVVAAARAAGIPVSDRRAVKLAYVTAVIALMDGRNSADADDVADAARLVLPLEPSDVDKVEQLIKQLGLDTLASIRTKLDTLITEAKRLSSTIIEAYAKMLRGEEMPPELPDVIEAFQRVAAELQQELRRAKGSSKTARVVKQYLPRLKEAIELMRRAEPMARELASRL